MEKRGEEMRKKRRGRCDKIEKSGQRGDKEQEEVRAEEKKRGEWRMCRCVEPGIGWKNGKKRKRENGEERRG